MSMSVVWVPVAGGDSDGYAPAFSFKELKKLTISSVAVVLVIRMCACLNWRFLGMIEKWIRPSVDSSGKGGLVLDWTSSDLMVSAVVFISTVKLTNILLVDGLVF